MIIFAAIMKSGRKYITAQIDPTAIIHNCRVLKALIGPHSQLAVAVKCNAYGHGVEIVLPALKSVDAALACVSSLDEARQFRNLGWQKPVLLLGSELSIYQGQEKKEHAQWVVENQVRVTPTTIEDIEALSAAGKALGKSAIIHLMHDSGMCRMGLKDAELLALLDKAAVSSNIIIEGLYTHFANADDSDRSFTEYQLNTFEALREQIRSRKIQIQLIHAANSAAALNFPQSLFNMVRIGISAYGYYPSVHIRSKPDLKPSMKLVSYLTLVKKITAGSCVGYGCTYKAAKDMVIGLVPIGYGDGYDRRLSNAGKMVIRGRFVPVIGRVSMDQTILDVSDLINNASDLSAGEEVTVISNIRQEPNSVESLAKQLNTIPNEIVTRLGPRITRVAVQ